MLLWCFTITEELLEDDNMWLLGTEFKNMNACVRLNVTATKQ